MFRAADLSGLALLAGASDAERRAALRDQLTQHGVVCLRFERPLTSDEFESIATMIAPIKDPVGRTRDGRTLRYNERRHVIDAGYVLPEHARNIGSSAGGDAVRPGLFEFFHTDDSFVEDPAAATILHARRLPPSGGGDTRFIDMRAAFTLLEPALQAQLLGLRAVHCYDNRGAFAPRASATGPLTALADAVHPIVRAHPISATPALYFDLDRATHIEGMNEAEGRALLQRLQDHAERNAPRYDHCWHLHDVLLWDNASVQHKASGDFPVGEPRRFWRHLISGDRPVAYPGRHPESA